MHAAAFHAAAPVVARAVRLPRDIPGPPGGKPGAADTRGDADHRRRRDESRAVYVSLARPARLRPGSALGRRGPVLDGTQRRRASAAVSSREMAPHPRPRVPPQERVLPARREDHRDRASRHRPPSCRLPHGGGRPRSPLGIPPPPWGGPPAPGAPLPPPPPLLP